MAWDSNEKGSWAWFTKEASKYGGVEAYIHNIEKNAKDEAHEADMKFLTLIIASAIGIGAIGKTAYDKIKQKISDRKELKQKSNAAKEILIYEFNSSEDSKINSTT